jgi:hypothetical protein
MQAAENRRKAGARIAARLIGSWVLLAGLLLPMAAEAGSNWRERIAEKIRTLREARNDRPELRPDQVASLGYVYYAARTPEQTAALAVTLPDEAEVARFLEQRKTMNEESLAYLDDFYGTENRLKALAIRDTDGDGLADYRVSDYFGKFSEGDVDVDGDGVRNVYDSHPYDKRTGGSDGDGDGIPDAGFVDGNRNGLPDHLDWAAQGRQAEMASIQLGLFRDYKIALVERDAQFDLSLARAVDDAVRRLYRDYFESKEMMPTLRTVAVEHTALLNETVAEEANDETSAQVFSQTQSLTIYDAGRDAEDDLALLGLLAHEIGHCYHMSLDWDYEHPELENARNDFPAPTFVGTVKPFGWTTDGYFDGALTDDLPVRPQFLYSGISEPEFLYKGKPAMDWAEWLNEIYYELGEPDDYLEDERFVSEGIVGDYSLTSPYEWYGDNVLAYLLVTLEGTALTGKDAESAATARQRLTESLRVVWPGFYHRNISPAALTYFSTAFPITAVDRKLLAGRYVDPVIGGPSGMASPGTTPSAR